MPSRKSTLTITLTNPSIPFRSSRLAVPPTPFSPRPPISPDSYNSTDPFHSLSTTTCTSTHPHQHSIASPSHLALAKTEALEKARSGLPAPPATPLAWMWQCHLCSRRYCLSVTRRCLDDGHSFCAGTTVTTTRRGGKRTTKIKKHRACGSEFVYRGWKSWGKWRRGIESVLRDVEARVEMRVLEEKVAEYLTASAVSPLFGSMSEHQAHDHGRWFSSPESLEATMATPLSTPEKVVRPLRPARPDEGDRAKKGKNCWGDCDYPSQCRWGNQYGVASPATPAFSFSAGVDNTTTDSEDAAGDIGVSGLVDTAAEGSAPEHNHDIAEHTATTTVEIPVQDAHTVADAIDGVDTSPPTSPSLSISTSPFSTSISTLTAGSTAKAQGEAISPRATAFAELASLVQSAQRRKSRSEEMGSSPLASQPLDNPDPMPALTRTSSSKGSSRGENEERGDESEGSESEKGDEGGEAEKKALSKKFGEFEVDFRRGMEKANELFTGVFGTGRERERSRERSERSSERIRERNVKHLKLAGKGGKK